VKSLLLAIATIAVVIVTARPTLAQTAITQCQTISGSGSYQIPDGTQLHSSGSDCLVVTAPDVKIISYGPVSITGNGDGAGVHATSTATNFHLGLFSSGISSFNVGIELDSAGGYVSGNYEEPLQIQSVNTAILINNGSHNTVGYVITRALWNGVWILGGAYNQVIGPYHPDSRGGISGYAIVGSQSDGIRIDNSIGNLVAHYTVIGSEAGIHLVNGAQYNVVTTNFVGNSGVGILNKYNAEGNFISGNWLYRPDSQTSTNRIDLQDDNANCDNRWFDNVFLTASPASCIH
jgi:hypothetical protein